MALLLQVGNFTKTVDLPPVKASTLRSTLTRFDIDLGQEVSSCLGAAAWVLLPGCCCLGAAAWVLLPGCCCLGAAHRLVLLVLCVLPLLALLLALLLLQRPGP